MFRGVSQPRSNPQQRRKTATDMFVAAAALQGSRHVVERGGCLGAVVQLPVAAPIWKQNTEIVRRIVETGMMMSVQCWARAATKVELTKQRGDAQARHLTSKDN